MDRRAFLRTFQWAGLAAPALLACRALLGYLVPPLRASRLRKIFVAPLPALPAGDIHTMVDLQGAPVAILHLPGEPPRALSMVCTHLGCRVHWQPKDRTFLCPCHAGVFDARGDVLAGPPPRPLPSYEVSVEESIVFVRLPEA